MDASVERDRIILDNDLLLNEGIDLLLEEITLVDVILLEFLIVLLEVSDVFDDLLQNVIGSLCSVVLECSALRAEKLHFLLVIVQQLDCLFRSTLSSNNSSIVFKLSSTYIERIDSVLDGHA